MEASQAPHPESDFQEVIEVEEEPAPKRKKYVCMCAWPRGGSRSSRCCEAFRRWEGHADVPPTKYVGGTAPGPWLYKQRRRRLARGWRRRAAREGAVHSTAMSDEEIARLEALGVRW